MGVCGVDGGSTFLSWFCEYIFDAAIFHSGGWCFLFH